MDIHIKIFSLIVRVRKGEEEREKPLLMLDCNIHHLPTAQLNRGLNTKTWEYALTGSGTSDPLVHWTMPHWPGYENIHFKASIMGHRNKCIKCYTAPKM